MKNIILLFPLMFILTACPEEKDSRLSLGGLKDKKIKAVEAISQSDYSLESLLKIQDYVFEFSEKVHLIKEDRESLGADLTSLQTQIKKDGAASFCKDFILPQSDWKKLESFCVGESIYKCSPDIKNFPITYNRFLSLIGDELRRLFDEEMVCK